MLANVVVTVIPVPEGMPVDELWPVGNGAVAPSDTKLDALMLVELGPPVPGCVEVKLLVTGNGGTEEPVEVVFADVVLRYIVCVPETVPVPSVGNSVREEMEDP